MNSVDGKPQIESRSRSNRDQSLSTLISLLVIAVVLTAVFYKTVFAAQPISKIYAISSMDSLYHPEVKGANISSPIDPCIYFFQMPTTILIEKIWQQGEIPLWNPDNACGHPIMANIESGVFSWHHFLFPSSSEYLYNLGIVARLFVMAIGTFLLARNFKIAHKFAVFAGLSYALCPHILREVELTKESWCFPWALYLFMTCGKKASLKNLSILAATCGLLCATIHPECSFNIIMLGCLMVTLQRCLEQQDMTLSERVKVAGQSAAWLMLVGIGVFCVAAPVLLPFAEFMRNSDCYKFEECAPPVVSLPALLLALVHPAMSGSSAFLSIFCLPASLIAFYKPNRQIWALLIGTVIAITLETLVGPLAELFKHKPFNMLEPIYLQPVCMLLLSCLMAEGLQQLSSLRTKPIAIFIAACLVALAVPAALGMMKIPLSSLDWDVDKYAIVWGAWRKDAVIALLCCIFLVLASSKLLKRRLPAVELLMVGALVSQLTIARMSLPCHPSFTYQAQGPVSWLQAHTGRMMAMGRHFIVPNINLTWGLADFRHFNGLYPPRYLDFQALSGGRRYFATHYRYEDSLTNTIDLASVKYITSHSPVYSTEEIKADLKQGLKPIGKFAQDVTLQATPLRYNSDLEQAICGLQLLCSDDIKKSLKIQFATLANDDKELWSSDEFPLTLGDSSIKEISQTGRWALPKDSSAPVKLAVRINNLWSNEPLWPVQAAQGMVRNNAIIAVIDSKTISNNESRFKLMEICSDNSRIYQNKQALPEAFTVAKTAVKFAKTQEEARALVSNSSTDWHKTAVIEDQQTSHPVSEKSISDVTIRRPNANQVVIEAECSEPSYLILTDSFFPGWKAFLNNDQPLEIVRANYLFRAVSLPTGRSTVSFKYQPQSLLIGFCLFALALLTIAALALGKRLRATTIK